MGEYQSLNPWQLELDVVSTDTYNVLSVIRCAAPAENQLKMA